MQEAAGCKVRDRTNTPGNIQRAGPDLAAASGMVYEGSLETCISATSMQGCIVVTFPFRGGRRGTTAAESRSVSRGQVVFCTSFASQASQLSISKFCQSAAMAD